MHVSVKWSQYLKFNFINNLYLHLTLLSHKILKTFREKGGCKLRQFNCLCQSLLLLLYCIICTVLLLCAVIIREAVIQLNLSLCSCRSPQQRTQDLWVIFNNVNITVTFSYTSLLILSRKQHLQRCTLLQTEETLELYNGQNNCGTNNNNIIKSNRIFYYALMIKMYQQRDLTLWSAKFKRKVAA